MISDLVIDVVFFDILYIVIFLKFIVYPQGLADFIEPSITLTP